MTTISTGAIVNVYFTTAPTLFNVKIIYAPQSCGGNWILKSSDGLVHGVMIYERMSTVPDNDVAIVEDQKKG